MDCRICMADFMGKMIASATATASESGYASGEEDGFDNGYFEGHMAGHTEGVHVGYAQGEEHGYQRGENRGFQRGYLESAGQVNQDSFEAGVDYTLEVFADQINGSTLAGDIYAQGADEALNFAYDSIFDDSEVLILETGEIVAVIGQMTPESPEGFEFPKPKPKPKSAKKKPAAKKTTRKSPAKKKK